MKSRQLINLLLLIVIIALGAVAYLRPGLDEPEATALTSLGSDDIERITLTTTQDTIEFEKQGDNWWLAGEPQRLADKLQVEQLTDIARLVPARRYAADELSPEKLGLSDNSPALALNNLRFIIGDTAPLNKLRYLQRDNEIFLVKDLLGNFITARENQFISRNLFPSNTSIKHINITGFEDMPADDRNQLMQHWETAQAIWVRSLNPDSDWQQTIGLTLADDRTIRYQLRFDDEDMVLGRIDWDVEYHMGNRAEQLLLDTVASPVE